VADEIGGENSIAALAAEAGISRQRLYEHHADLVAEFKTTADGVAISPSTQALQQQLASSRERVRHLEGHITLLQDASGHSAP
jgi:AcrR family transcriptional regulator